MKEFFSSPTFLLSAIGLVAFGVVIALLWRNTVWEARGITPAMDVEQLRKRITGLFPKSIAVWCVIAAVIILVAIGLRGLSGTSSTHSESGTWLSSLQSPSLATVAAVTKSYWLWIFIVGIIAWVYLSFIQKENETLAKTLKATVGGVMFMLFVVVPAGFWVRDAFLPQVICKDVSAHETRSCLLNTSWSTWIKFAEGPENNGMQLCFTPGGRFERTDVNGTTFWRFKADEGRLVKAYRLFPGNQKCPAAFP